MNNTGILNCITKISSIRQSLLVFTSDTYICLKYFWIPKTTKK